MASNPYESPLAASIPASRNYSDWNVAARDGSLLVVPVRGASLPDFCIKSNEPANGNQKHLDLDWVPNRGIWIVMFGALGHVIAKSMYGKKVSIDVPVAQQWLEQRRRKAVWGWLFVALGMTALVLGTIGYVMALLNGADDRMTQWVGPIILSGPFVSIAGAVYLAVKNGPLLKVRKYAGELAWLDGAHPDFLRRLPDFHG